MILQGEETARYCTGCHVPTIGISVGPRYAERKAYERTLSTDEYLEAPVWSRLLDADQMEVA
jgi:hypothetical protein